MNWPDKSDGGKKLSSCQRKLVRYDLSLVYKGCKKKKKIFLKLRRDIAKDLTMMVARCWSDLWGRCCQELGHNGNKRLEWLKSLVTMHESVTF